MSRALLVQILGAALLIAGAYLAWGLAPALGAAGAATLLFGVAAERPGPDEVDD